MGRIKDMGFGVGDYVTPNNLRDDLKPLIFKDLPEVVKAYGKQLLAKGWRFYAVSQQRSYCQERYKLIAVGDWAILSNRPGFKCYVVAHEMAHAFAGCKHQHNHVFMEWLKRICPAEFVHYELEYKPRNARAAGIGSADFDELF